MESKALIKKTKGGRPKILQDIDLKQIEMFGYFRATYETMADLLGCSVDTIRRNMQNFESEFCKSYKKGASGLKLKLSEAQVQLALSGNATMLIWLGKQYLDQSEAKQETETIDNEFGFEGFE